MPADSLSVHICYIICQIVLDYNTEERKSTAVFNDIDDSWFWRAHWLTEALINSISRTCVFPAISRCMLCKRLNGACFQYEFPDI